MLDLIIGVGLLAYKMFNSTEERAYSDFKRKRRELERTLEEHEENIRNHIEQAQASYDFHFLTDLHYSSMKVADAAYKTLGDAKIATDAIFRTIRELKKEKSKLEVNLEKEKLAKNKEVIKRIYDELKNINQIRKEIYNEKDALVTQQKGFLEKVRSLNNQTRRLKECIRDKCGSRGAEWYQKRLESRKNK